MGMDEFLMPPPTLDLGTGGHAGLKSVHPTPMWWRLKALMVVGHRVTVFDMDVCVRHLPRVHGGCGILQGV
jgi:hypothetical protein